MRSASPEPPRPKLQPHRAQKQNNLTNPVNAAIFIATETQYHQETGRAWIALLRANVLLSFCLVLGSSQLSNAKQAGANMFFSESDSPEPGSSLPASNEAQPAVPAAADEALPLAARIINSKSLFGESRIIHIEHRGMIYRMSITNQNRLILQK